MHSHCLGAFSLSRSLTLRSPFWSGLGVVKWPYCHQIVWNGGILQKGGVPTPGRGRQDVGRAVVMEPSLLGLKACLYSREGCGRRKEERKDGGLTRSHRFARPRGLIILDCLFSTFCCHGVRTKTWLCSDLRTLVADALSPYTCCVSAYWMRLCEGGWLTRWLSWAHGGGGEASLGNLWGQSYCQPHYPGQAANS